MARQSESKNAKTTSRTSRTTRACSSKLEASSDCAGKNCSTRKSSKRSK